MDKSQSYPDIPGAAEYYCEVIEPSKMIAQAFEVIEMQFYAAYGGCTRGYSSERKVAEADSDQVAKEIAAKWGKDRGIDAPYYYYVKEAKK
jgi:hypothetical protein